MMYKIYVPPNAASTITSRFSVEELSTYGIHLAENPDETDVIVSALAEELVPFVNQYGSMKNYLVWCDEPLWSCTFQKFDTSRVKVFSSSPAHYTDEIFVNVMNCFTGDIYFNNQHFLNSAYHINFESLRQTSKKSLFKDSISAADRKIVSFLTYRNEGKWNFDHPSGIHGLSNLRTRVALEGRLFNKVDIVGRGWPSGMALKEDRAGVDGKDPFQLKLEGYENYHFALCFENTYAPYYVTEKIWHAIIAGCLPIYFAGPQHTIYQDFPRNSFIDYFDFKDPIELFEFVDSITEVEFNSRMTLCLDALQNSLFKSQEGQIPLQMQLSQFAYRIKSISSETVTKPIAMHDLFPTPNWQQILGNKNPIILDIGANDGGTSEHFARSFPESRIFAFEPDERPIARFKQRLTYLPAGQVTLFEGVVSDVNGEIDFFMSDGKGQDLTWYDSGWDLSGSIKKPIEHLNLMPNITFPNKISVKSTTLDTWAENNAVIHVDLAWIDVQGAELNVISQGKNIMDKTRFLYMEYADKELYEGQASVKQLLAELPGFEVLQVYAGDVLLRNRLLK
jgi:FkbM family methyltransferase